MPFAAEKLNQNGAPLPSYVVLSRRRQWQNRWARASVVLVDIRLRRGSRAELRASFGNPKARRRDKRMPNYRHIRFNGKGFPATTSARGVMRPEFACLTHSFFDGQGMD